MTTEEKKPVLKTKISKKNKDNAEKAVGLSFNPSADPRVDECKRKFADAIAFVYQMKDEFPENSAPNDMLNEALRFGLTAQMWAVKGITWKI